VSCQYGNGSGLRCQMIIKRAFFKNLVLGIFHFGNLVVDYQKDVFQKLGRNIWWGFVSGHQRVV
jgi:hypothetical protein